jgi:hypothetical protein
MPLYGVCPACQGKFPLSAALQDAEARRALGAAIGSKDRPGLPAPVLWRLIPYLDLHSPPSGKAMAWPKVARLIEDLAALVGQPAIRRDNGQQRVVSAEVWAQAMDAALSARDAGNLSLPLDDHGWIATVAYRLAGAGESHTQQQRETALRGETPVGHHPSHNPAAPPNLPPRTESGAGSLKSIGSLLGIRKLSKEDQDAPPPR